MEKLRRYFVLKAFVTAISILVYFYLLKHDPYSLVFLFYVSAVEAFVAHIIPVNGLGLRDSYPAQFAFVAIAVTLTLSSFFHVEVVAPAVVIAIISDAYVNVNNRYAEYFHTVPSLLLALLLPLSPVVAYYVYAVAKFAFAGPKFSLAYSFHDHKYLYFSQLMAYGTTQLQNFVVGFMGATALYAFLSKVVSFPVSVSVIAYQIDTRFEKYLKELLVAGVIVIPLLAFVFGVSPLTLAGVGVFLSLFSFLTAEKTRQKRNSREVLLASVAGVIATLVVIVAGVVTHDEYLLLVNASFAVEYAVLMRV